MNTVFNIREYQPDWLYELQGCKLIGKKIFVSNETK
jgi:hypothetical protein